jgi:hypothetical protein
MVTHQTVKRQVLSAPQKERGRKDTWRTMPQGEEEERKTRGLEGILQEGRDRTGCKKAPHDAHGM